MTPPLPRSANVSAATSHGILPLACQALGTPRPDGLLDAIHGADEAEITDRSIDVYVKRLREKLGDDPVRPRYIATVRGAGYRAVGPVERLAAAP